MDESFDQAPSDLNLVMTATNALDALQRYVADQDGEIVCLIADHARGVVLFERFMAAFGKTEFCVGRWSFDGSHSQLMRAPVFTFDETEARDLFVGLSLMKGDDDGADAQ